jgi:hypothetical protein
LAKILSIFVGRAKEQGEAIPILNIFHIPSIRALLKPVPQNGIIKWVVIHIEI